MMTSSATNAVMAEGVDAGVPWHHGDPLREQRVLETGVGLVDRSNRDVVTVTGPDRLEWLHSICSQHLAARQDGDATEALVLSPHGHVEQHWQVAELGGTVWIDTEPGAGPQVLGYLEKMRFLKRVELADVSGDWSLLSLVGPATSTALSLAGLPVPEPGHAAPVDGGGFVRRMGWPGQDAADLLVPAAAAAGVGDRLIDAGAAPAGLWAFEALRIAARRPRLGFETDHRTIPHEVGWIGTAVHLNKGCYRGQETVARVHNLGRPPRTMVLVHLSGETEELPPAGTEILADGRAVGFLGTALHHWELGPVGLAVLKRSLVEKGPGTPLTAGGVTLAVDAEPTAD